MRISCPTCRTTYDVPEPKLHGRELRCATCKQTWTPMPAPLPVAIPVPANPPLTAPPLAPVDPVRAPVSTPLRKLDWRRVLGWLATITICASGIWASYHARSAIMRVWPPSIRLYHALALLVRIAAAMTGHHRPGP